MFYCFVFAIVSLSITAPRKLVSSLSLPVQVVLHFSVPVTVDTASGNPVLLLRVDPTTADADGERSAEYIPGLTQFVDVGVDAARWGH